MTSQRASIESVNHIWSLLASKTGAANGRRFNALEVAREVSVMLKACVKRRVQWQSVLSRPSRLQNKQKSEKILFLFLI